MVLCQARGRECRTLGRLLRGLRPQHWGPTPIPRPHVSMAGGIPVESEGWGDPRWRAEFSGARKHQKNASDRMHGGRLHPSPDWLSRHRSTDADLGAGLDRFRDLVKGLQISLQSWTGFLFALKSIAESLDRGGRGSRAELLKTQNRDFAF